MGSLRISSNWKYKYVDDNKVHLLLRIDIITSHLSGHKAPVHFGKKCDNAFILDILDITET